MQPGPEVAVALGSLTFAVRRRPAWQAVEKHSSPVTHCLFRFRLIGCWQLLILDPRVKKKTLCKVTSGGNMWMCVSDGGTCSYGRAGFHNRCTVLPAPSPV